MKYVIPRDAEEIAYKGVWFWKQFDEVEAEVPEGWFLRYTEGGIVHSFGYSQSSGHGEYISEYREEVRTIPLAFTTDAAHNAAVLQGIPCQDVNAVLTRHP